MLATWWCFFLVLVIHWPYLDTETSWSFRRWTWRPRWSPQPALMCSRRRLYQDWCKTQFKGTAQWSSLSRRWSQKIRQACSFKFIGAKIMKLGNGKKAPQSSCEILSSFSLYWPCTAVRNPSFDGCKLQITNAAAEAVIQLFSFRCLPRLQVTKN